MDEGSNWLEATQVLAKSELKGDFLILNTVPRNRLSWWTVWVSG